MEANRCPQIIALSCSSLLPVEDAARLIEDICKAGAIEGGGEVLAAFDLGEHLSQWASTLHMKLGKMPRSRGPKNHLAVLV